MDFLPVFSHLGSLVELLLWNLAAHGTGVTNVLSAIYFFHSNSAMIQG